MKMAKFMLAIGYVLKPFLFKSFDNNVSKIESIDTLESVFGINAIISARVI